MDTSCGRNAGNPGAGRADRDIGRRQDCLRRHRPWCDRPVIATLGLCTSAGQLHDENELVMIARPVNPACTAKASFNLESRLGHPTAARAGGRGFGGRRLCGSSAGSRGMCEVEGPLQASTGVKKRRQRASEELLKTSDDGGVNNGAWERGEKAAGRLSCGQLQNGCSKPRGRGSDGCRRHELLACAGTPLSRPAPPKQQRNNSLGQGGGSRCGRRVETRTWLVSMGNNTLTTHTALAASQWGSRPPKAVAGSLPCNPHGRGSNPTAVMLRAGVARPTGQK